MNKKDIIDIVSEKTNNTKKNTTLIIESFLEEVTTLLVKNEKVLISNFGTFFVSETKPMNIYSPYDGKLIKDVVQTRVRFNSSQNLLEKIKKAKWFAFFILQIVLISLQLSYLRYELL